MSRGTGWWRRLLMVVVLAACHGTAQAQAVAERPPAWIAACEVPDAQPVTRDLLAGTEASSWRAGGAGGVEALPAGGLRIDVEDEGPVTLYAFRPVDGLAEPLRVEIDFRVSGWEQVRYVAVGWMAGNRYRHVRIKHVVEDEVMHAAAASGSVALSLADKWQQVGRLPPTAIRVVVDGRAGPAARVDLLSATVRPLPSGDPALVHTLDVPLDDIGCFQALLAHLRDGFEPLLQSRSDELGLSVHPDAVGAAEAYFDEGVYQLTDLPPVPGDVAAWRPAGIGDFTSSRYRWHSLDFVRILLESYGRTGHERYLFTARDHADRWLSENFFTPSDDPKYAWYDHGTAERALTLALLWEHGIQQRLDVLFMRRLLIALLRHGELLADPSFYVRNQPFRHHNHAVFQDLALIALAAELAAVAPPGWHETGARRLLEQFDHLVSAEGASVENSFGYHVGLQKICLRGVTLLEEVGDEAAAARLSGRCAAMARFAESLEYPGGGFPALGDTWRRGRGPAKRPSAGTTDDRLVLYPESGYGLIAAAARLGAGLPAWQLNVFNTDLSITHKHADNLSFTLWANGIEWLIDPGYHSYGSTGHAARGRSVQAHNAVALDGESFPPRTGFAELRSTTTRRDDPVLGGSHEGYPQATVERSFTALRDRGLIFIDDRLRPKGATGVSAAVWFHAGDGLELRRPGHGAVVLEAEEGSGRIAVVPLWEARCDVYRGSEEPLAGWYYPAFAVAEPSHAWRCEAPAAGQVWTTVLVLAPPPLTTPEEVEALKAQLAAARPDQRK